MPSSESKFRVAICGAGIGGLALAVTIGKFSDIPVDLYEAKSTLIPEGAGISIRRRTIEILKVLGMHWDLIKVCTPKPNMTNGPHFRLSDNSEGGHDWFHQVYPHGGPTSMHRTDMVDVLVKHLSPTTRIHLNKRLKSYTETGSSEITMRFTDGTEATTNVLIGADGIRSPVRRAMFEEAARHNSPLFDVSRMEEYCEPSWTGSMIYRSLIPTSKVLERYPDHPATKDMLFMCGKNKHILSFPVNQGEMLNIVAYATDPENKGKHFEGRWNRDITPEEFTKVFSDFEPMARVLTECGEKPSQWALFVTNELPFSSLGNVALIGDASHAMTTHLGAGAGQAIEDAWILGRILASKHVNLSNVSRALRIHQAICLPAAQRVVRESAKNGLMYDFRSEEQCDSPRSKESLDRWRKDIGKRMAEFIGANGTAANWYDAERQLKDAIAINDSESDADRLLQKIAEMSLTTSDVTSVSVPVNVPCNCYSCAVMLTSSS